MVLLLAGMTAMILGMETATRVAESTGRPDRRFVEDRRPTVSLRLRRSFLEQIDVAAERRGMTRTAFIEEAVRLFLAVDTSLAHTNGHRHD